jgi:glycosyltransferase involved in cell wall biosynthesis
MNICIIASGDYFSTYGGGQVYVKNLVSGLNQRGHEISVISLSVSNTSASMTKVVMDVDDVKIWQITLPTKSIDVYKPLELQGFVLEALNEVLSVIAPDVVHANGWKYATSKVCVKINLPCVVTAHHGGIVCPNGMLMNQDDSICNVPASMENCLKCALHFVPGGDLWSPIVRSLPYSFSQKIAKSLKSIRNIPYVSPAFQTPLGVDHKLQQIEVLKHSPDRVLAPSRAIASALIRNGIPENKVKVIPHGITPLENKPLEQGLPKQPLRFGYVGRITYIKGLHVLLEALMLLPHDANYELHIYGDAASKSEKKYREMLKDKSKNLPIFWHGKVEYDEVQQAYYSFDVMILPSICLEVFGLTVLESLSAGRPVIGTQCGGPEDTIEDGVDSSLVEPNNAEALSQALKFLLDEPKKVIEMANRIGSVNTLDKHMHDLEKIYKEIASE